MQPWEGKDLKEILLDGSIIDYLNTVKERCNCVSKEDYLYALNEGLKSRPNYNFCLINSGYYMCLGSITTLCSACIMNKADASYVISKEVVLIVFDKNDKTIEVNSLEDITSLINELYF